MRWEEEEEVAAVEEEEEEEGKEEGNVEVGEVTEGGCLMSERSVGVCSTGCGRMLNSEVSEASCAECSLPEEIVDEEKSLNSWLPLHFISFSFDSNDLLSCAVFLSSMRVKDGPDREAEGGSK